MQACTLRNQRGFSLPTVVAMSVVACIFMLATAAMVVPATVRLTAERTEDMARSSAEASLDWTVQQLNNTATRSSVDCTTTSVPDSVLNSNLFSGTVTVSNLSAPTYSYLYNTQLDSSWPAAAIQGGNGWRVVSATIRPASGADWNHNVRVVLQPVYRQVGVLTQTSSQGPPQSMFNFAAFAGSRVGGNGNMVTNSYDSTLNPRPSSFQNSSASIGTNGDASLVGNAAIGGSLNLFGTDNSASGGPNVAVAQGVNIGTGESTVSGLTNVSQSTTYNAPQSLPQTPTAPSGSVNLGQISLSGNSSMTLSPGNYIVSSISITGNAQLVINNAAGPVNIYVQGAGSNAGINIAGNGIASGALPANLRIWYSGTGDTQIAGNGTFTGVVYAPNSSVTFRGNGDIYGAVVGNDINFDGNGTFHYDRSLNTASQFMWNPPIVTSTTNNVQQVAYWQAVSWQEW